MTTNPVLIDSVLNVPAALDRLGGDRQLFDDLATFFQEDSPGLLAELRDAIGNVDCLNSLRAAHSLKGLAANFGAERAVAALQAVESKSAANNTAELEGLFIAAETEIALVTAALIQFRQRQK